MFNPEAWLSGGNDVLSIEQIPGMLLVGSRDGLWALEGDGSGILGMIEPLSDARSNFRRCLLEL